MAKIRPKSMSGSSFYDCSPEEQSAHCADLSENFETKINLWLNLTVIPKPMMVFDSSSDAYTGICPNFGYSDYKVQ